MAKDRQDRNWHNKFAGDSAPAPPMLGLPIRTDKLPAGLQRALQPATPFQAMEVAARGTPAAYIHLSGGGSQFAPRLVVPPGTQAAVGQQTPYGGDIPNMAAPMLGKPAAPVGAQPGLDAPFVDRQLLPSVSITGSPLGAQETPAPVQENPLLGASSMPSQQQPGVAAQQPAVPMRRGLPSPSESRSLASAQIAADAARPGPATALTRIGGLPYQAVTGGPSLEEARRANMSESQKMVANMTPQQMNEALGAIYSTDPKKQVQARAILSAAGETNLPAITGEGKKTTSVADQGGYAGIADRSNELRYLNRMARENDPRFARFVAKQGGPAIGYLAQTGPFGTPHPDLALYNPTRFNAGMSNAVQNAQALAATGRNGLNPNDMAKLKTSYIAQRAPQVGAAAAAREFDNAMGAINGGNQLLGGGNGQPALGGGNVPVQPVGGVPEQDVEGLPEGPEKEAARVKRDMGAGVINDRTLNEVGHIYDTSNITPWWPDKFTMNSKANFDAFKSIFGKEHSGGKSEEVLKHWWRKRFGSVPN